MSQEINYNFEELRRKYVLNQLKKESKKHKVIINKDYKPIYL